MYGPQPPEAPKSYTFTVCTATFDRAYSLPRVYESLRAQSFTDFEWLVIDDGSTDETGELIQYWHEKAPFAIRYFWQENAGAGAALNRGIDESRGFLFAILDSDDAYVPTALERLKFHWESIPVDKRHHFVGVTGLVQGPSGEIVGSRFPSDVIDSDSLTMRVRFGVKGQKTGCQRTDVLRFYKFPVSGGEKNIAPGTLWNRIALNYKTRFVNEVFRVYYDTPASRSSYRNRLANPRRGYLYYREFMWLDYDFPLKWRLRANASYVRFALHSGVGLSKQRSEIRSPVDWIASLAPGFSAYLLDRLLRVFQYLRADVRKAVSE